MNDNLPNLVRKYLNNQCSEEEMSVVLSYLKTSEGQHYLSSLIDEDIRQAEAITQDSHDHAESYDRVLHRLRQSMVKKLTAAQEGSQVKKMTKWYRIAATFSGFLLVAAVYYLFFHERYTIYQTAYGQTKEIKLEDGTRVMLNAHSTLRYPADFSQHREVWLEGEAFFDVEELNKEKARSAGNTEAERVKFVVHTHRLLVEVTGTSFNISEREDKTQVVLNSGKVRLKTSTVSKDHPDELIMAPGELVEVFAENGKMVKKVVDPEVYSSWKVGKLVCYDTPLTVIAQHIRHNFGVKVVFQDPLLSQMLVTGTLPTDHLELLLEVLTESMKLEITQKNNHTIFIKSK